MGSNASQEATNINNVITNNIMNFMSNITNNADINQEIKASCSPGVISDQTTCIDNCINRLTPLLKQGIIKSDELISTCNICKVCSVSDVNLKEFITLSQSIDYQSTFESTNKTKLKNDLSQFTKDSNVDNTIDQIVNSVSDSITKIKTAILSNASIKQSIKLKNVQLSRISLTQSSNIVQQQISSIKAISENVSNLANKISQKSTGTGNTILTVGLILISLLLIVFLIVAMSKSKDLSEFFRKIAPYLTFFIIASIILAVFLITKPSIITYIDPITKKPVIDTVKLLEYLTLIYSGLGVFLFIFFYLYNRKRSSPKVKPVYKPKRSITTVTETKTETEN